MNILYFGFFKYLQITCFDLVKGKNSADFLSYEPEIIFKCTYICADMLRNELVV